ncbi:MAG: threonylcarbamoyl-AMP synthase [Clostridia bacterium]|nr:threonylcarbamoyl-AMP synthase [Clostridia bacterium]
MTKIIKVDPENYTDNELFEAAGILRNGGLCAFPTETVYGLGAIYTDCEAVLNIFKAKGRPADNPLIVHICDFEQLYKLVKEVPETALNLAKHFWGGPLTIILPKSDCVPYEVTAGLDTVAVRFPSHPIATALIRETGIPIAAPSANLSGKPSPTAAEHVIADMKGKADIIIDGGNSFFGIESTVVDLSVKVPQVLRPGAVTIEDLRPVLGNIEYGSGASAPKSPGMKYKHYAPDAPVYIIEGDAVSIAERLADEKTGILTYNVAPENFKKGIVLDAGKNSYEYAAHMFYYLRKFDELGVTKILAVPPEEDNMGYSVRNRLYKSAGGKVICE